MPVQFIPIRGGKYCFIDNQGIRNSIDEAGRKIVVFVEGYDDWVIYRILYEGELNRIDFIDVSVQGEATGGADTVKEYIEKMVFYLKSEERYFGITDRDYRTDDELQDEIDDPKYNNKLFIFSECYTLENYFIDSKILYDFLRDKSISNKKLIPIIDINKIENIINIVCKELIVISAANWTLKFFRKEFLSRNTPCDENIVTKNILHSLSISPNMTEASKNVLYRYEYFKWFILNRIDDLQKYLHGKYFLFHFNKAIKEETERTSKKRVNVDIDNAKAHLARILKNNDLPDDFKKFEGLVGIHKAVQSQ